MTDVATLSDLYRRVRLVEALGRTDDASAARKAVATHDPNDPTYQNAWRSRSHGHEPGSASAWGTTGSANGRASGWSSSWLLGE